MKKLLFFLLLLPALLQAQTIQSLTIGSAVYPNLLPNNEVRDKFPIGTDLSTVLLSLSSPTGLLVEGTPTGADEPTYQANFTATAPVVPLGPIQLPARQAFVLRFYSRPGRQLLATYTIFNTVSPLPVRLVSFTAAADGRGVRLRWQTADEQQMLSYTVERSDDGQTFAELATVATKASPGVVGAGAYELYDATPAAYYRLRCTDTGPAPTYSPVVTGPQKGPGAVHLVQVGERFYSYELRAGEQVAHLELYSIGGQKLLEQTTDLHRLNYPAGECPYLLIVFTKGFRPISKRVL
jgi:hypothetical protein